MRKKATVVRKKATVVRKKAKKRSAGTSRVIIEEPKSYASVYAAKLAKEVAQFAPRQAGSRKGSAKRGR